jgi:hypothetical protein
MDIKRGSAVGFKRLYRDLDIIAVVSSMGGGWLCIIISRLIDGPHEWDWFGAVVGASICATCLAKQRERSRRHTGDLLDKRKSEGES